MSLRISGRALRAALVSAAMGCFLVTATASAAPVEVTPLGAIGTKAAKGKKKCKKAKKGTAAAKKKKCKKKKKKAKPPAATSRQRASVTFSATDAQIDLHIYDAVGNHTGWQETGPGTGQVFNNIPSAVHSGDVVGPNSERFTDNAFLLSGANREFSYVVCFYDPSPNAPMQVVFGNGQFDDLVLPGEDNQAYAVTYPGSPGPPAVSPC